MLLTIAGYDVATAANGFDALLQLKRTIPDVVISDLNMPEMFGFEAPVSCTSPIPSNTRCRDKRRI